jgi:3-hydroxyisobutyrate dehydrogenase
MLLGCVSGDGGRPSATNKNVAGAVGTFGSKRGNMSDSESSASPALAVGVVGLGQMGGGIARNLDKAGLLVGAYDVVPTAFATQKFSERVTNMTPAEIGRDCHIVLFVVPASPQIREVLSGQGGVLSAERRGQILCDLTTSNPPDTLELAALAGEAGRAYLDCGMSGGATGADQGTLTLFIGGDEAVLDTARPALEPFTGKLLYLGPPGAGHAMKLVHNMILHTTFMATVEGCRILEDAGVDLAVAIEALNSGNARSYVTEIRFPRHILNGKWDARSYVSNLAKDLGMAVKYSHAAGRPALYGTLTSTILDRAIAQGRARDDFSLIYKYYDELIASFEEPIVLAGKTMRGEGR